jgi:hypothetical protein
VTPYPVETRAALQASISAVERRRRRAELRRSAVEAKVEHRVKPKRASNQPAEQRGLDDRERTRWSDQTLWPDSVANPRRTQV